jgi:hypothetical protein
MGFSLRDGIVRDGRIDFARLSDDLNTVSQALASIHRATTVLSARHESRCACNASRKVLPLNNFCKELYLSFSSSAVAEDFDCHHETQTRDISDSVSHLLRSVVSVALRFKRIMTRKRPAECLDYESTERATASGSAGVESFAQSKDPFIRARETGHFYPTAASNVPGISFKQNLQ